ncbi:hypothetical protein MKW98_025266 [Papaver atlanticum]|uniref:Glycosyl hydrolase family 38 C-terminal domain-containing protein n=1 Tax=Papaver atlanticum TaxID=357466 RepID=A0AAD4X7S4_9MAGN|nr:hypothetical protein MKW98_025266 [Papaver atlanticum]
MRRRCCDGIVDGFVVMPRNQDKKMTSVMEENKLKIGFELNQQPTNIIGLILVVPLKIVLGPLMHEVHQQFSSWVYQVTILYKDKDHLEVEFTIPTRSGNMIFLMTKTNLEFQLSELLLMTCIQQKGLKKTYQKGKGSLAGGVQDLRVKLSGS